MSLSNYAESALLQHLLGQATYTPATTLYVALATADPTEAATGAAMNEVANSGNYARTAVTFPAAASGSIANSAQVNFPQASAAWGTVTHYAIVDNATYGSGNVLAYGALSASQTVNANNTPYIVAGDITVDRGGALSNYLANALLDFAFRNQAFSAPANFYVGLSTVTLDQTDTGTSATEPSGNGYARTSITAWDAESGGASANTNQTDIGPATGSWGTPLSAFVADASTLGNILFWADVPVGDQQAVGNGDTWRYAAGAITVSLA